MHFPTPENLRRLADASFELIPLHQWDAVGLRNRKIGKAPIGKDWWLHDVMFCLRGNSSVTSYQPMKLHILSDLHIEFAHFELPETDADLIVLAGDVGVGTTGVEWITKQESDKPIIYVPGNHEFYGHDISLIEELKNAAPRNVHVLNNEQAVIDGVRFLGAVLWTDFLLFGEVDKWFSTQRARQNMNDFFVIQYHGRRFMPADSFTLHQISRQWLTRELEQQFDGKTVVVTHHAPSAQSVPPRFARDLLTPAFASNLEHLMGGQRAALWIHGHMHDPSDYEINGTRVICNPRGYPGESASWTNRAELVVEV